MPEFIVFNADMLNWAIDRAGIDPSSLEKSFENIDLWRNGTKKPSVSKALELAKKLDVPLGYFCLSKPPKEDNLIPDFRTVGNHPPKKPSLDLRRTIEHAKDCQEFLSDYLKKNDYLPFEYQNILHENMGKQKAVEILRRLLKNRKTGVSVQEAQLDLIKKIEDLGILVQRNSLVLNNTRKKLDPNEFRGFAICDNYVPLIFINTNDSRKASDFTLIHELVHVLLSSSGISGYATDNKTEAFCDAVAAEYLVPKDSFIEFWRKGSKKGTDELIASASKKFGVSRWVILRRTKEFKLIDSAYYQKELTALLNASVSQKRKGFIQYNDAQEIHFGERLVNAAVISAYAGDITFREASRLTCLGQKALVQKARDLCL